MSRGGFREGVQGVRTPTPIIPNMYETTVYPCRDKTKNDLGLITMKHYKIIVCSTMILALVYHCR